MLDAYAAARKAVPQARDPRLRIEHAQVVRKEDVAPIRRAGRHRLDAALARQRRHALGRRPARPGPGGRRLRLAMVRRRERLRWPSAATSPSRSSTRSGGSTRRSPGRTPRAVPPAAGTPSSASRSRKRSAASPPARPMPRSPRTGSASSRRDTGPTSRSSIATCSAPAEGCPVDQGRHDDRGRQDCLRAEVGRSAITARVMLERRHQAVSGGGVRPSEAEHRPHSRHRIAGVPPSGGIEKPAGRLKSDANLRAAHALLECRLQAVSDRRSDTA